MGNIDVIGIYRYHCEENIDMISILIFANIAIPIAQQSSATKAGLLNLPIFINRTYTQTHTYTPSHTHNQTHLSLYTFIFIILVGLTVTFIFSLTRSSHTLIIIYSLGHSTETHNQTYT